MKYCIYCGAQLPDAAAFCMKCGKPQEQPEEAPKAAPAPVRTQQAPVSAPAPAQSAPMGQTQNAETSKISTPGVGTTPPPYVKPLEDSALYPYYKAKEVITVYNAKLFDEPKNFAGKDISLDLFPVCMRITTASFMLVGTYFTKTALTPDTIRQITMSTESALLGTRTVADIFFTDPEAQPIRITSKSKRFPDLLYRLAAYANIQVVQR